MKKILRNILAIILIILGLISGLIPFLQGWIFILIGYILLDFKNKKKFEEKIFKIISKTKIGKKLTDFWINIKNKNKDVIKDDHDKKIRSIYHDLNKDIKNKDEK